MNNEKYNLILILVSLFLIVGLETVALIKGMNGQLFSLVIGALTSLVGYFFGRGVKKKR